MARNTPFSFQLPILPLLNLYVLALLFLPAERAFSADPFFEACSERKYCGAQLISFPFYVDGQKNSFCGYPGFAVSCNGGVPIIRLPDGNDYLIRDIFYGNQSLRISNAAFSRGNETCIAPVNNMTVIPGEQFSIVSDHRRNVIVLYNCSTPSSGEFSSYRIGCSARNETESVLALYEGDPNLSKASKECRTAVAVSVEATGGEGLLIKLERGVMLNWTASNCSFCADSGGLCGFTWNTYHFRCFCPDRTHAWQCPREDEHKKDGLKMGLSLAVAVLVVGVGILLGLLVYSKMRNNTLYFWNKRSENDKNIETYLSIHGHSSIKRYSYWKVKKMTNSFRNKLGEGSYGTVYKGELEDGRHVAVKVLSESKDDGQDFLNEVTSIGRTSHVNVVTLLGFCFEGRKRALVYEFMSNGSLEQFIYEKNQNSLTEVPHLGWETLYQISIGIARGLEYLHKGCNTRILHFDIKPHNILLNEEFEPKISDFGLAKVCNRKESIISLLGARGTPGYIAPEVFNRGFGEVSYKSDVYSYGMMVLEMVGGRKNLDVGAERSSKIYLPHWFYEHLELNKELELQGIRNEEDKERAQKMVITALWCIQTIPSKRPSMSEVVSMLEGNLKSSQIPPKPFLSSPPRAHDNSSSSSS